MKISIIQSFLMLSFLMLATKGNCQSTKSLTGVWRNSLNSTLTITKVDSLTGQITGTYQSPSGTAGEKYELIGWVNNATPQTKKDNVICVAFSVRWKTYGSITSWTGYLHKDKVDGKLTITTLWSLVRANSDFEFDHILVNSDIFKPVASTIVQ